MSEMGPTVSQHLSFPLGILAYVTMVTWGLLTD